MAADASEGTFCVIGIRTDRTRVMLARNLTRERAMAVVDALSDAGAFADLRIEREPEKPPLSGK